MENWTSIFIGITTSFIASILFLFSAGFIKKKSNQLLDWVASKNKRYSNKMYIGIAQNKSIFAEMFPSYALLYFLMNFLIFTTLLFIWGYEIQLPIIESLKENPDIEYEELYQLKKDYNTNQLFKIRYFFWNNSWILSVWKYFLIGITFFGTTILFIIIERNSRIKEYNLDFIRKLEIITPYVEKEMIDKLKSKWRLMSSKEDFHEIYVELIKQLKIAKEKNKSSSHNL